MAPIVILRHSQQESRHEKTSNFGSVARCAEHGRFRLRSGYDGRNLPAPATTTTVVSALDANNVFLASKFIGSTVYSSSNENVGDINDMVIGKDGKVQAVIIGVGGFLGLGEKDVAVPMDRIQFSRDESNNMKFMITSSRQELEQAPAFDRTKLIVGGGAPASTTVQ